LKTQLEDPAGLADVRAAALSPDGRTLALSGTIYGSDEQGTAVVVLWDMAKQRPRLLLDHAQGNPQYLDFAPDGRSFVTVGFQDAIARVWDPRNGKLRETIRLCEPGPYHVNGVRFAADSRHFATAMGNGTVYLFRIQPPAADVKEVAMAPDALAKAVPPTELWKRLLGKPAPELQQIKGWIYGKPTRLADLRGRHVLLHFWNMESEGDMAILMLLRRMFGAGSFEIVVLCADYGGTVAEMRKYLTEREQQRWGGGELPFPFAMDGGGKTPIAGTRLTTYGATHAAYGILEGHRGRRLRGSNLLIDPDGKVLRQLVLPDRLARSGVVVELQNWLGKQPKIPAVESLDRRYALAGGEVLRRVAPPLPPERRDYLLYQYGAWTLQLSVMFEFDGKLSVYGMGGDDKRVQDVLRTVIKLKPFEFQASRELMDLKLPGDWVCRKDIPPGLLVRHLETILRQDFKQAIRVQEREVERDVIVVRGQFQPPPGSSVLKDNTVHFHDGAVPPSDGRPGTFQSVQELLDDFENIIHRNVINETEGRLRLNLRWQNHLSPDLTDIETNTPAGAAKLKSVLGNLSKQTGMRFQTERRKLAVWHFEKEK
jgi:hypothetical protein